MNARLRRSTAEEEAAIRAGIDADSDTFELSDSDLAAMRPASDVMAADVHRALVERQHRGRQQAPTKQAISLRLDRDLLDRLRASGPGWQARVDELLRKALLP